MTVTIDLDEMCKDMGRQLPQIKSRSTREFLLTMGAAFYQYAIELTQGKDTAGRAFYEGQVKILNAADYPE